MFSPATKHDAISLKNNAANDVNDDLNSLANQAGKKVRGLFNTASDEISHARETVTTEIRTNPVRSTVIALGVGVFLGALLRR